MTAVRKYQDLVAWQKGMQLVKQVYLATASWPSNEMYGLTSQIRRAAVSIPSNIAEGFGRRGDKEFGRFLQMAYGSLLECETQAQIAAMLGYLVQNDSKAILELTGELGKIIGGLSRSTQSPI